MIGVLTYELKTFKLVHIVFFRKFYDAQPIKSYKKEKELREKLESIRSSETFPGEMKPFKINRRHSVSA